MNQVDSNYLTKNQVQLSYEKIFLDWDVDLTADQELMFEKERFEPMWIKYAGNSDSATFNID